MVGRWSVRRAILSAQYEHTMIITKGAPIVITQH